MVMEKANIMKKSLIQFGIITFCAVVLAVISAHAAPAAQANKAPAADSYLWDAELVAFDAASRMITVKANVVGEHAPEEIAKLKAGEKVMVTWSGVDRYTSGVNHVVASTDAKNSEGRFSVPVEFVSYDAAKKYLTFKIQIPAEGVAKLKNLKPGEWITATSIHGKATEAQPIVSIRPYVIEPNENSN
jgi:hypothetical protein